jgi:5'-nucleotidase/UDP-sugar diphosphatase
MGVSLADDPGASGTGRFPQISGMRFVWNPDLPVGSRILSVEVKNSDGSYYPRDENATYKLASIDYLRNGGDNYTVFLNATSAYDYGPKLTDALQEYLADYSPVSPQIEGRISKLVGVTK